MVGIFQNFPVLGTDSRMAELKVERVETHEGQDAKETNTGGPADTTPLFEMIR